MCLAVPLPGFHTAADVLIKSRNLLSKLHGLHAERIIVCAIFSQVITVPAQIVL